MNTKDVILCIDDERIILRLIEAQLNVHFADRFEIRLAENAEVAHEIVNELVENKQNLIMAIVDQILPGQQGHEFLTEITDAFPNVIKILFSGKSDFSSVIAAINEAEIFRYLIKPWDEADFINIINRGLQQYYIKENIELQLAEIHHRVKNNLTIITCLLELQIGELKDDYSRFHFQQSINRINSIAKVHELIYESEDMASVDIKAYLEKIIPAIQASMEGFKKHVQFNFDIPSHKLKVNQAIPLGLIFNELITNSFKYAFENSEEGSISIKMDVEHKRVKFVYEDSGNGFKQGAQFHNSGNLGLTLINLQLQQLESIYSIQSNGKFKLEFSFDTDKTRYLNGTVKNLSPLAF